MSTTKTTKLNKDIFHGVAYTEIAQAQFQKAIDLANRHLHHRAIEEALEAMALAELHNLPMLKDLHIFLAGLNADLDKYDAARAHCWKALYFLPEDPYANLSDKNYIEAMLAKISIERPVEARLLSA